MPAVIQIRVHKSLYLRNPEDGDLGRKIVGESIKLLDKIGFESFTFKKLGVIIKSPEASIYRYFESKHQLLSYLCAWYWSWVEYRIMVNTTNIHDSNKKLRTTILTLTHTVERDPSVPHVNEAILHRLVVNESGKIHIISRVKKSQQEGRTEAFESLLKLLSGIIRECGPKFKYPMALALTLISVTHRQLFYAEHFPTFTDLKVKRDDKNEIETFLNVLVFSTLGLKAA